MMTEHPPEILLKLCQIRWMIRRDTCVTTFLRRSKMLKRIARWILKWELHERNVKYLSLAVDRDRLQEDYTTALADLKRVTFNLSKRKEELAAANVRIQNLENELQSVNDLSFAMKTAFDRYKEEAEKDKADTTQRSEAYNRLFEEKEMLERTLKEIKELLGDVPF